MDRILTYDDQLLFRWVVMRVGMGWAEALESAYRMKAWECVRDLLSDVPAVRGARAASQVRQCLEQGRAKGQLSLVLGIFARSEVAHSIVKSLQGFERQEAPSSGCCIIL
jgi:hypothetical protein